MATNSTSNQPQQPRNIFEQLAFGLQTVNENVIDLYKKVDEIHAALFPPQAPIAEPDAPGAETDE